MDESNADHSQDGAAAFEGLPAAEAEETKAILDELNGEAPKPADEKKPDDTAKPEDKKPDETAKPEGKTDEDGKKPDGADDGGKKPESRRDVRMMPAWVHEAFKDKTEKERVALEADLAAARGGKSPDGTGKGGESEQTPKTDDELSKEAKALAEKHGITEELAVDLIEASVKRSQLTPEAQAKLKEVDNLKAIREAEVETAQYSADFDRTILPIVKAEYGDDVPPEVISKIKDDLKELAYDPEGTYAKVPYTTIYRGEERFRDLVPPKARGAEATRGGATQHAAGAAGEKPDLSKPLPEDTVKGLSAEDFDTYSGNMEKWEASQRQAK